MSDSLTERQHTVKKNPNSSRSPAGDAFSILVVRIFQLNGFLIEAGDTLARPAGQSSARWQVLAAAEHGPATVAQMARRLGLARQSVQRVANLLVAEGLARFGDNPKDRRANLLSLTDTGLKALQEIQGRQKVWADALGEAVGEMRLLQALAILEDVAKALEVR